MASAVSAAAQDGVRRIFAVRRRRWRSRPLPGTGLAPVRTYRQRGLEWGMLDDEGRGEACRAGALASASARTEQRGREQGEGKDTSGFIAFARWPSCRSRRGIRCRGKRSTAAGRPFPGAAAMAAACGSFGALELGADRVSKVERCTGLVPL